MTVGRPIRFDGDAWDHERVNAASDHIMDRIRGLEYESQQRLRQKYAAEVDPANINVYIDLAETYISRDELDNAHRSLTPALQVDPKGERVWMLKADIFRQQNEPSKALECYKRVLRFNPDNQEALNSKTSVEAMVERNGGIPVP